MIEMILGAIVANTLILAVLGFLAKSIINHFLQKDITTFKSKLESDAKSEIEQFKSVLEKERIRLQISYGGIFEKQANVIVEIYKLIVDFGNKASGVITPIGEGKEAFTNFVNSHNQLFDYYEENKVLLPEEVEQHFEKLRKDIYRAVMHHRRIEKQLERPHLLKEKDMEKLFDRQDKVWEIIDSLPMIKNDLTNRLRNLIGVNNYKDVL